MSYLLLKTLIDGHNSFLTRLELSVQVVPIYCADVSSMLVDLMAAQEALNCTLDHRIFASIWSSMAIYPRRQLHALQQLLKHQLCLDQMPSMFALEGEQILWPPLTLMSSEAPAVVKVPHIEQFELPIGKRREFCMKLENLATHLNEELLQWFHLVATYSKRREHLTHSTKIESFLAKLGGQLHEAIQQTVKGTGLNLSQVESMQNCVVEVLGRTVLDSLPPQFTHPLQKTQAAFVQTGISDAGAQCSL